MATKEQQPREWPVEATNPCACGKPGCAMGAATFFYSCIFTNCAAGHVACLGSAEGSKQQEFFNT